MTTKITEEDTAPLLDDRVVGDRPAESPVHSPPGQAATATDQDIDRVVGDRHITPDGEDEALVLRLIEAFRL